MKVFVTGANGFVGKHLIAALSQRGHEVFAGMRQTMCDLPPLVKVYQYNLLHDEELSRLLKDIQPDGIIHLASQSKVSDSWKDPVQHLLSIPSAPFISCKRPNRLYQTRKSLP